MGSEYVGETDVPMSTTCVGCELPLSTMPNEPLIGEVTEDGWDIYHFAHAPESLKQAAFDHTVVGAH